MSDLVRVVEAIHGLKSKRGFVVMHSETLLVDDFAAKAKDLKELMEMTTEVECPVELLPALEMSDRLAVYWKHTAADVAGEFVLRSPLIFMMESAFDPEVSDETFNGVKLGETRTVDYAAYSGHGWHAVLEVKGGKLIDEVLFFDSRQMYRMRMSYIEYISLASLTRGIEYWQLLYCEDVDRQSPRIEKIMRGVELLSREFGEENYTGLLDRLERLKR
jgi:hypothetical protein